MRILCSLTNQDETKKLAAYLDSQDIQTEVDGQVNTDWGSPEYGTILYKVWVIDEDQVEKANALYEQFIQDPSHARYSIAPPFKIITTEPKRVSAPALKRTQAPITFYLVALCCLLFALSAFTSPEYPTTKSSYTVAPVYASPIKQLLLYDFPKAYELLAQMVNSYGIDALQDPQKLPVEGQKLMLEFQKNPYWQGYYEEIVAYFLNAVPSQSPAWFEKIYEGQLWRIFTPVFLHGDIFHLLFNMIWLYVLGKQLEIQLGIPRYLLFIAITAAFSNTAQYLMTGPNFIGFSGVLCAMFTFIWRRQIDAPWEGYQLQRSTFLFIMIFIFGMLALQLVAFAVEITTGNTLPTSIANTAHIAGAALGLLLAKMPLFTQKSLKS